MMLLSMLAMVMTMTTLKPINPVNPLNPPVPLKWHKVAPGVWRAAIGRKDRLDLLTAAEAQPASEGLKELHTVETLPVDPLHTTGEEVAGYVIANMPLTPDEKLYGLEAQPESGFRLPSAKQSEIAVAKSL